MAFHYCPSTASKTAAGEPFALAAELEKGDPCRQLGEGDLADLRYGGIDRAYHSQEPAANNKFSIPSSLAEGNLKALTISHDEFYQDNDGKSQKVPETVSRAIRSMQGGVLATPSIATSFEMPIAVTKTEKCHHQELVFFPDTEFTILNSESNSLELTAFVSEMDKKNVDESAIYDEWEDSDKSESESESASINEKTLFHRVDNLPKLITCQSLITLALQSTPALPVPSNGLPLAVSPDSDDGFSLMMKKTNLKPVAEVPRSGSAPRPIIQTTTDGHYPQLALSPRTNRRTMLATELTVSLRQYLLWERQQNSETANAVLKRRHTAYDIANLKQYPDKVYMSNNNRDEMQASWNQYFSEGLGEYHSKGW